MKKYIQDDDGDLPYKLMVISNNDSKNNNNEGTSAEVVQQETNAVAADHSPISDTGTWEIVNPGDGN